MNLQKNLSIFRRLRRYSQRQLAQELGVSHTLISYYENGKRTPDSKMLIKIARKLDVSVEELMGRIYEKEHSYHYRKKRLNKTQREYVHAVLDRHVNELLEVLDLAKVKLRKDTLASLRSVVKNNADIREAVRKVRAFLGVDEMPPLENPAKLLELKGFLLLEVREEDMEIDGANTVVDGVPIIILKKTDKGDRQRFTLAHELGRMVMDIQDETLDEEKCAHRFASDFLLPTPLMYAAFGERRKRLKLEELANYKQWFKVSMAAIVMRLKDLGIITDYTHRQYFITAKKHGFYEKEPVPVEPERFTLLERTVYKLLSEDIITSSRARSLLGENKAFDYEAEVSR